MKKHTAIITAALALAMLVSCNNNTAEPAVTTTGEESSASTETTVMTTVVETTTDVDSFDVEELLAECTVYDVTTGYAMYTMNSDVHGQTYEVQKKSYIIPYVRYEDRCRNDEQFNEKIAVRFTDIDGFVLFADIWTEGKSLFSKIRCIAYSDYVIECSDKFNYTERSFEIKCSDNVNMIAIQSGLDTDAYVFSECGYISVPSLRNNENYQCKLMLTNGYDGFSFSYINTLFSDIVSFGGELTERYSSEDDLYAESGKIILDSGVPYMKVERSTTIGEWYHSDEFPYAQIRDEYQIPTLRDMAKRFGSIEGYEEFKKIYEELERGKNDK